MKTQKPLSEQLKEAYEWAKNNLDKAMVYCPALKDYVRISRNGIKHGLRYNAGLVKTDIVYNLLHIISTAKISNRPLKKEPKKGVKAVYEMNNEHTYKGNKYKVYLIIKENNDGKYYYDSGIIEKIKG